jgi:four helix bundle protein
MVRCIPSCAANYRPACRAKSNADFINKLKIVEEELDESMFWLEFVVGLEEKLRNDVVEIYKEAKYIKKNNITNENTIEFFLSDKSYLEKYKIIRVYKIKDLPDDLFFGKNYLLIIQNINK